MLEKNIKLNISRTSVSGSSGASGTKFSLTTKKNCLIELSYSLFILSWKNTYLYM